MGVEEVEGRREGRRVCSVVDTAVCVFSGRHCDLLESGREGRRRGSTGTFLRDLNLF